MQSEQLEIKADAAHESRASPFGIPPSYFAEFHFTPS
jgi:hypothetical protein